MSKEEISLSQYDQMTEEELKRILQEDEKNTAEGQLDTEEILYIAKLLADRGKCPVSAEKALQDFKKYYLPEKAGRKKRTAWLQRAAAAAAVLTLTVTVFAATHAVGLDLWGRLVSWNEDSFHYMESEKPQDIHSSQTEGRCFDSLREVMQVKDLPAEILPQWIPERFQMEEVRLWDNPTSVSVMGRYLGEGQKMMIRVVRNLNGQSLYVEKDDGPVEVYEAHGRDCYIFTNIDHLQAVWSLDNCECYVSGDLTMQEMKQVIDSIP